MKFFKKKIDEGNLKNKELFPNYLLEHEENFDSEHDNMKYILDSLENDSLIMTPAGEEPTEEQIKSLLKINKHMTYLEKIPILAETYHLGFLPVVQLKSAKERIGKIHTEKRGEYNYPCVYSSNTKIYLHIENYNISEVIEYIFLGGSPSLSFGTGPSHFDRIRMYEVALKIVGEDKSITIFRDDLGYQRVEFTRDDLKKYTS